eukprot:TRINITY_DN6079_c0_g1_i1.p1 TRINITY_DN6079_c0_g1~~TRINITY_DN6079_c0_g1_i1.p1  ORF type:complete len:512 (+),score=97.87 TRINITY_DN6079_c0_g1_i1:73-1536(+)
MSAELTQSQPARLSSSQNGAATIGRERLPSAPADYGSVNSPASSSSSTSLNANVPPAARPLVDMNVDDPDTLRLSRSHSVVHNPDSVFGVVKATSRFRNWHTPATEAPKKRGVRYTRIADRDASFKQSSGRLAIRRTNPFAASRLHMQDWFHTFVNWNTTTLIFLLILLYTLIIVVYACLFYWANDACALELEDWREAFVLSVITVSTIGYGTTDPYFNSCLASPFILLSVTIIGLFLDSLFIGLLFTRFSRGTTRAKTVIFSDKAVIRAIRGHWYLMLQVTELQRHPLLEAHIRLYAIQHHSVDDQVEGTSHRVYFQTNSLRLQQPDDELGGNLLLMLPNTVVHRIDNWSSLLPLDLRRGMQDDHDASGYFYFPDVLQRHMDAESKSRETTVKPEDDLATQKKAIQDQLKQENIEILAIVEGVDPYTAATVQARHSYTHDDIVFDHTFAPCVTKGSDGACQLDMHFFHDLVPAGPDELLELTPSVL